MNSATGNRGSRFESKARHAETPYLSVVATARNDNHGGELLQRMQLFIDGLVAQSNRFSVPIELVLVEWNPPADRPPLVDAINWPEQRGWCDVRVITVPEIHHRQFDHADALPLFQMIGKNVGIRRATGTMVLATNVDILFSDEFMQYVATRSFQPDRMYRIDRHDVDRNVPMDASHDERLEWCRKHVIRLEECDGTHDLRSGEYHRIYWKRTWRVRLLELLQDLRLVPVVTRTRLHLNACGDFTLMARDRWDRVRGYPEFQMYSMHLDSVLCTQAHFDGTHESILKEPMRIYHIEHGTGSGFTPEGERALNRRLQQAGIAQLDHDAFHRMAVRMRRERRALVVNDKDWGLADETFEETGPYEQSMAAVIVKSNANESSSSRVA